METIGTTNRKLCIYLLTLIYRTKIKTKSTTIKIGRVYRREGALPPPTYSARGL